MKTSLFRFVTLSAICASFIGMAALAPAYDRHDDRIRNQIAHLQAAKSRALAHHHRREARSIQGQIDSLRARLHHRWH